jgi:hypothetical protein
VLKRRLKRSSPRDDLDEAAAFFGSESSKTGRILPETRPFRGLLFTFSATDMLAAHFGKLLITIMLFQFHGGD